MRLFHLAERHGDITGQAGLGSEQIVTTAIQTMLADIITDGKKLTVRVVEQLEIHAGHFIGAPGKVFQLIHALLRGVAARVQFTAQLQEDLRQLVAILPRQNLVNEFIEL